MKTKTDQSGGRSDLGTSHDRWKDLTDCTAFCKSQDSPCWKKGKIQHPIVVYRETVSKCFCAFIKSTPAHCCALFSSPRLPSTVTTWKQDARWIYSSCSAQPPSGCEVKSSDCKWHRMQWKGHQRLWLHSNQINGNRFLSAEQQQSREEKRISAWASCLAFSWGNFKAWRCGESISVPLI